MGVSKMGFSTAVTSDSALDPVLGRNPRAWTQPPSVFDQPKADAKGGCKAASPVALAQSASQPVVGTRPRMANPGFPADLRRSVAVPLVGPVGSALRPRGGLRGSLVKALPAPTDAWLDDEDAAAKP